ncbi:uncharacterized protein SCDLUD_001433 [Saccharomycodes ludwigii]|uniref:uncharacterized protein n=2 Tax=Saccharomycodes ludwigii TaxID=36035 RepID=UPI001E852108|nr:hypothetical protein SCDLUD_001433 [Saccharomycodes ludwigii]KAH3901663.1 hypothetical protein SCDLUD_001433 [Saccharomycodes ludwigii]
MRSITQDVVIRMPGEDIPEETKEGRIPIERITSKRSFTMFVEETSCVSTVAPQSMQELIALVMRGLPIKKHKTSKRCGITKRVTTAAPHHDTTIHQKDVPTSAALTNMTTAAKHSVETSLQKDTYLGNVASPIDDVVKNDDFMYSNIPCVTENHKTGDIEERRDLEDLPLVFLVQEEPLVGKKLVINCEIKRKKVQALCDTGSPTSFVDAKLVEKLGLKEKPCNTFTFKGAVSETTETCVSFVKVPMKINDKRIMISAYVVKKFRYELLIGNPVIKLHSDVFKELIDVKNEDMYLVDMITDDKEKQIEQDAEFLCRICPIDIRNEKENELDGFEKLPEGLRKRFQTHVTNELPGNPGPENFEYNIVLKEGFNPPELYPYRLTPKMEQECRKILEDLIKKGFVSESNAACGAPIILVRKKDQTWRLVVDYRELNKGIVNESFPIPSITELFAKVGDAKVFTTLDLHSGYHQLRLNEKSKDLTSFTTPFGHFRYEVLPFGIKTAPKNFSRFMSKLLDGIENVYVYLDDILIATRDKTEHYKILEKVLEKLKSNNLYCKRSKCHFVKDKVNYLGHVLTAEGLSVDENKISAIKKLTMPSTIKGMQTFLGLANYYRKFISKFSELSQPLYDFASKKAKLGEKQRIAFEKLKEALTSTQVLVPFVEGDHYELTSDASLHHVGGVLERYENGKLKGVIGYFSKHLSETQSRYPVGEIELLGIILNLKHFRYYLHGRKFTLNTDHSSLLSFRNKTEPHLRLARWLDYLGEYTFELRYIKGTKNVVADCLSRPEEILPIVELDSINPKDWFEDLLKDPWSAAILVTLDSKFREKVKCKDKRQYETLLLKFGRSKLIKERYSYEDKTLLYEKRICVPNNRRRELLHAFHDSMLQGGHFGVAATTEKIADKFYFPKLHKYVERYIRHCLNCQLNKKTANTTQGMLKPLPVASGRWQDLSIDFITGLPPSRRHNDMIMVVVDRFSKRSHWIAMKKTANSKDILQYLYRYIFAMHGFPRTIVSDRDIRFTASVYEELTKRLGIKLLFSSSNHPQTDGQTEAVNKIVNRLLRTFCSQDQDYWDVYLPHMEFCYNSTPVTSTGISPFQADIGYTPNTPLLDTTNELDTRNFNATKMTKHLKALSLRINDSLQLRQEQMEETTNAKRKEIDFHIGEYALLHRDAYFTGGRYLKVQSIYLGPFKIVKVGTNVVELDLPSSFKKHRTINIKWIKHFYNDPEKYPKQLPRTKEERIHRITEITAIIGYETTTGNYYCKMLDVNPELTATYEKEEINLLPSSRLNSLLANYKQLLTETSN